MLLLLLQVSIVIAVRQDTGVIQLQEQIVQVCEEVVYI